VRHAVLLLCCAALCCKLLKSELRPLGRLQQQSLCASMCFAKPCCAVLRCDVLCCRLLKSELRPLGRLQQLQAYANSHTLVSRVETEGIKDLVEGLCCELLFPCYAMMCCAVLLCSVPQAAEVRAEAPGSAAAAASLCQQPHAGQQG
jgi:hypothetical protein